MLALGDGDTLYVLTRQDKSWMEKKDECSDEGQHLADRQLGKEIVYAPI
jgi:hypothetical protein